MEAAKKLAEDGIEAEVVDPRTLRPLDDELIFESVRKTNRCVVVEEGWRVAGFGAEIADRVQRDGSGQEAGRGRHRGRGRRSAHAAAARRRADLRVGTQDQ